MPKLKMNGLISRFGHESRIIEILDQDVKVNLNFTQAEQFHQGNAGLGACGCLSSYAARRRETFHKCLWDLREPKCRQRPP